jgi:hypothetical protein
MVPLPTTHIHLTNPLQNRKVAPSPWDSPLWLGCDTWLQSRRGRFASWGINRTLSSLISSPYLELLLCYWIFPSSLSLLFIVLPSILLLRVLEQHVATRLSSWVIERLWRIWRNKEYSCCFLLLLRWSCSILLSFLLQVYRSRVEAPSKVFCLDRFVVVLS